MTHGDLVQAAEKWLLGRAGCGFAFTELRSIGGEIPDAIGFRHGRSILIECKADRGDFLSDRKKPFRRVPRKGMGCYRYYMSPADVVRREDLPERWGLLWAYPSGIVRVIHGRHARGADFRRFFHREKNVQGEISLMYSALRRLHLRGRIPEIYDLNQYLEGKR